MYNIVIFRGLSQDENLRVADALQNANHHMIPIV